MFWQNLLYQNYPASGPSHYLDPIFASGEDGAIYDPTLLTTMWTDTAKTTNVASDGDIVRVWDDARATGRTFVAPSDALSPVYRPNSGFPYLEMGSGRRMFLQSGGVADTSLNFSSPSMHARAESITSGRVIIGFPQNSFHTNPYFRNLLYHNSGDKINTRFNGFSIISTAAPLGSGNYPMIGTSPANARLYVGGGTYEATGTYTITYPNGQGPILGCNSSGSENMDGRFYGICFYNRATTDDDATLLNNWNPAS